MTATTLHNKQTLTKKIAATALLTTLTVLLALTITPAKALAEGEPTGTNTVVNLDCSGLEGYALSLESRARKIEADELSLRQRMAALEQFQQSINQQRSQVTALQNIVNDKLAQIQTIEDERLAQLAQMMSGTAPKSAAAILENMDPQDAAAILSMTSKSVSGNIMTAIGKQNPKFGADVSLYFTPDRAFSDAINSQP